MMKRKLTEQNVTVTTVAVPPSPVKLDSIPIVRHSLEYLIEHALSIAAERGLKKKLPLYSLMEATAVSFKTGMVQNAACAKP